jgi:putative MFS transporter
MANARTTPSSSNHRVQPRAEKASLFAEWYKLVAFWCGSAMVAIGVALHVPMFLMGRKTGWRLVGMPMGAGMLVGMALIILGIIAAAYGLKPRKQPDHGSHESIVPPEDAPLTKAHWIQIGLLAFALVIDVMKAATLGFVTPGMRAEYGLSFAQVAMVPFSGLTGTFIGSLLWGALADSYGRRASILLAAVFFVGTSICGAMPSFYWNVLMCFMMGLAAGGMLPVANALLAEIMPTKHRGWCLVLIGGIGTIGGYYATSELSAILQPYFGWRIMWLIGFPTGMLLIALSPLLPESARFLLHMGRVEEARATLARYGVAIQPDNRESFADDRIAARGLDVSRTRAAVETRAISGLGTALTLTALAWGFVNFGVMLWLPGNLIAEGRSVGLTSAVIAKSTLIAIPTVAVAIWLYAAWSTKRALILSIGITVLGLVATLLRHALPFLSNPLISVTLLIVGTSAAISILMPYSAESFPVRQRGRATGWVAGCSKVGGVIAQGLAALALVPAFAWTVGLIAIPAAASLLLVAIFGHETRGRDLRELELAAVSAAAAEAPGAD